jgi:hypothetical protein
MIKLLLLVRYAAKVASLINGTFIDLENTVTNAGILGHLSPPFSLLPTIPN